MAFYFKTEPKPKGFSYSGCSSLDPKEKKNAWKRLFSSTYSLTLARLDRMKLIHGSQGAGDSERTAKELVDSAAQESARNLYKTQSTFDNTFLPPSIAKNKAVPPPKPTSKGTVVGIGVAKGNTRNIPSPSPPAVHKSSSIGNILNQSTQQLQQHKSTMRPQTAASSHSFASVASSSAAAVYGRSRRRRSAVPEDGSKVIHVYENSACGPDKRCHNNKKRRRPWYSIIVPGPQNVGGGVILYPDWDNLKHVIARGYYVKYPPKSPLDGFYEIAIRHALLGDVLTSCEDLEHNLEVVVSKAKDPFAPNLTLPEQHRLLRICKNCGDNFSLEHDKANPSCYYHPYLFERVKGGNLGFRCCGVIVGDSEQALQVQGCVVKHHDANSPLVNPPQMYDVDGFAWRAKKLQRDEEMRRQLLLSGGSFKNRKVKMHLKQPLPRDIFPNAHSPRKSMTAAAAGSAEAADQMVSDVSSGVVKQEADVGSDQASSPAVGDITAMNVSVSCRNLTLSAHLPTGNNLAKKKKTVDPILIVWRKKLVVPAVADGQTAQQQQQPVLTYVHVGQSEWIKNSFNPDFTRPLNLTIDSTAKNTDGRGEEAVNVCKFCIYNVSDDKQVSDADFLCSAKVDLTKVVTSYPSALVVPLHDRDGNVVDGGSCVLVVRRTDDTNIFRRT